MELEELLDTQLQHVGVKGMKWGVRKSRTSKDRASETTPKPKSTFRKIVDSNKRELGMRKLTNDLDGLSDNDIRTRINRIRNENDMRVVLDNVPRHDRKRRKSLRDEYLDRDKLSDAELQERVNRLKLEDNLRREVVRSSKPQREAANEIIKAVSKNALDTYTDPKTKVFSATGNATHDAIIKDALNYTKEKKVVPEKYGNDGSKKKK